MSDVYVNYTLSMILEFSANFRRRSHRLAPPPSSPLVCRQLYHSLSHAFSCLYYKPNRLMNFCTDSKTDEADEMVGISEVELFVAGQVIYGVGNLRNVRDVRRLGLTPCLAAQPLRTILPLNFVDTNFGQGSQWFYLNR